MNSGHIILINGAPGSGKSTLCRQLTNQLHFPYVHISMDRFYEGLTQRPLTTLQRSCLPIIYQGFLASVQAFAATGNRVLLDMMLSNQSMKNSVFCCFISIPTHLIGLNCPVEILKYRNRHRPQPRKIVSDDLLNSVHKSMLYDLELDTKTLTPAQCGDRVIMHLNTGVLPTALNILNRTYRRDS